jgi:fructosamine-3-kinase
MLAALHDAPWSAWGGGSSWVGACPVDPQVAPDAVSFYEARLLGLARRCGMESVVSAVTARLGDLLPAETEKPALLHGDLWWGNVLWGADGRPWLIDPSVHGGHPEEDLAMLGLFGDVPDRLLGAYSEIRPLEDGWEDRVALFLLPPLLVHTVIFGGGYRSRVEDIARRLA